MTQSERTARHEAEIARFGALMGDVYRTWLAALPRTLSVWTPVANDDHPTAANDNIYMDEAA